MSDHSEAQKMLREMKEYGKKTNHANKQKFGGNVTNRMAKMRFNRTNLAKADGDTVEKLRKFYKESFLVYDGKIASGDDDIVQLEVEVKTGRNSFSIFVWRASGVKVEDTVSDEATETESD